MAGKYRWTPEKVDILRGLAAAGLSDKQIFQSGQLEGVETLAQVINARQRYGILGGWYARDTHRTELTMTRVVSDTPERQVIAPEESAQEEMEAVWARSIIRTERKLAKERAQGLAVVRIMTDKPVALSISSDWHVTPSGACDLPGLRAYAEAIRDTQGAFAIAVGDLYDNPIKHSKNMDDVPDELMLVALLFGTFGYKLLGTTSGNHDDWTKQFAGIDALRWLTERERIHYAPDELVYLVELVDPKTQATTARYCIATRHKYYRHSNLNPTHSCFRWLEDRVGQWPQTEDGAEIVPDVLAIGHNHVACCEERSMANKPIWGARMGPWQYTTGFGRAGGWKNSPPTAPTFILFPHRARPIEGFADYRSALDALGRHRAGVAA
jgi:hypothetical protein